MPPKIEAKQALNLAKSLVKGTPHAGKIALTLASDTVPRTGVTQAGERVRKRSPTGRVAADYLFYPDDQVRSLAAELRRTLSCPVHFEAQTRALYAADASNYRQVPMGVVVPRNAGDVVEAMGVCRRYGVPIVARGGGTAIAGQTVNVAVVFDFSR